MTMFGSQKARSGRLSRKSDRGRDPPPLVDNSHPSWKMSRRLAARKQMHATQSADPLVRVEHLETYTKLLHALGPKKSRRKTVRKWAEYGPALIYMDIISAFLSTVSVVIYIAETYVTNQSWKNAFLLMDILFATLFFIDWAFRFYIHPHWPTYLLSLTTALDFVTILPPFLQLGLSGTTRYNLSFFRFIRIIRIFRLFRIFRLLALTDSEVQRHVVQICFTFLALMFCAGGIFYELEGPDPDCGDDDKAHLCDPDQGQFTYFHEALYFSAITISTVGFGDFAPTTWMAQFAVMLELVLVFTVIPVQSNKLLELLASTSKWQRQSYTGRAGHILVTGSISTAALCDFIMEFFHEDHGNSEWTMVILQGRPPDRTMEQLMYSEPFNRYVHYLEGSPMVVRDLDRASPQHAAAIFVLCDKGLSSNAVENDALHVMEALAIDQYFQENNTTGRRVGNPRLFLQLLRPEACAHFLSAIAIQRTVDLSGVPNMQPSELAQLNNTQLMRLNYQSAGTASQGSSSLLGSCQLMCIEELKLMLLGLSTLGAPGLIALYGNLGRSIDCEGQVTDADPPWRREYNSGAAMEVYRVPLSPFFGGLSYAAVAKILYEKYRAILLGVEYVERALNDGAGATKTSPFDVSTHSFSRHKMQAPTFARRTVLRIAQLDGSLHTHEYSVLAFVVAESTKVALDIAMYGFNRLGSELERAREDMLMHARIARVVREQPKRVFTSGKDMAANIPLARASTEEMNAIRGESVSHADHRGPSFESSVATLGAHANSHGALDDFGTVNEPMGTRYNFAAEEESGIRVDVDKLTLSQITRMLGTIRNVKQMLNRYKASANVDWNQNLLDFYMEMSDLVNLSATVARARSIMHPSNAPAATAIRRQLLADMPKRPTLCGSNMPHDDYERVQPSRPSRVAKKMKQSHMAGKLRDAVKKRSSQSRSGSFDHSSMSPRQLQYNANRHHKEKLRARARNLWSVLREKLFTPEARETMRTQMMAGADASTLRAKMSRVLARAAWLRQHFHCRSHPWTMQEATIHDVSFSGHIIIIGNFSDTNVYYLLAPLRSRRLQRIRPIILIDLNLPSLSNWEEICMFQAVYLMTGSLYNHKHLESLNAREAHTAIVLPPSTHLSAKGDLQDTDVIFSLQHLLKENPTINIFTEVLNHRSISYLMPHIDPGVQTTRSISYHGMHNTPEFASGKVFVASLMDNVLCQTFFNGDLIRLFHKLFVGEDFNIPPHHQASLVSMAGAVPKQASPSKGNFKRPYGQCTNENAGNSSAYATTPLLADQPCMLIQISMPEAFIGRTFKELFGFLIDVREMVCIGLYRTRVDPARGNLDAYVYCNPDESTVLDDGDRAFVLLNGTEPPPDALGFGGADDMESVNLLRPGEEATDDQHTAQAGGPDLRSHPMCVAPATDHVSSAAARGRPPKRPELTLAGMPSMPSRRRDLGTGDGHAPLARSSTVLHPTLSRMTSQNSRGGPPRAGASGRQLNRWTSVKSGKDTHTDSPAPGRSSRAESPSPFQGLSTVDTADASHHTNFLMNSGPTPPQPGAAPTPDQSRRPPPLASAPNSPAQLRTAALRKSVEGNAEASQASQASQMTTVASLELPGPPSESVLSFSGLGSKDMPDAKEIRGIGAAGLERLMRESADGEFLSSHGISSPAATSSRGDSLLNIIRSASAKMEGESQSSAGANSHRQAATEELAAVEETDASQSTSQREEESLRLTALPSPLSREAAAEAPAETAADASGAMTDASSATAAAEEPATSGAQNEGRPPHYSMSDPLNPMVRGSISIGSPHLTKSATEKAPTPPDKDWSDASEASYTAELPLITNASVEGPKVLTEEDLEELVTGQQWLADTLLGGLQVVREQMTNEVQSLRRDLRRDVEELHRAVNSISRT